MPKSIQQHFDLILNHETRRARRIAGLLLGHKNIGVWEVLIPLIFIFNSIRNRQRRELFVRNLLFTKKMALEAARDIRSDNRTFEWAMHQIHKHTEVILSKMDSGIYSQTIRTRQMEEMELLIDHYLHLFETRGSTYEELIRNAYPTKAAYEIFLDKLAQAEKAVGQAAKQTLGPRADAAFLDRLEEMTIQTRRTEAEKIFATI